MTTNLDDKFNRPDPVFRAPIATAPVSKDKNPPVWPEKFRAVLSVLKWDEEDLEVPTKYGPRLLRKAFPTPQFYELWRDEKPALKELGISLGRNPRTDEWEVCLWRELPKERTAEREAAKAASRATDAVIDVPKPDGLEYLGYQRAGIAFGMHRPATLIGDEMGLGKTIQAIGIMNVDTAAKRILVLCPASLKLNWHRELTKWLVRKRIIFVGDSKVCPDLADGIVIINYDVLHKHADFLHSVVWDIVVADEAHYLKNRKARRSEMVFGYKPTKKEAFNGAVEKPAIQAKRKIFLTGTPIANRTAELFPIIHYLDPVSWPTFFGYARRYCAATQGAHGWDFSGASNLEELQDKLRQTIMVRRLKKDVLKELPPKRRQIIEIPAEKDMVADIRAEMDAYDRAMSGEGIEQLEVEAELAKASDDPEVYKRAVEKLKKAGQAAFTMISAVRAATAERKIRMQAVRDHLEEAVENSGKVIIFAHHKTVVAAILEQFGNAAVAIVGDTPMKDRQDNVDRFQKDPTCKVIVGSFGAMGVGHTLTASSHVIMVELDWVPGNVTQAEDRAHRIGQLENVLVQHLVLEGSLDARIANKIVEKQDIIDRALDKITLAAAPISVRPKRKSDDAATAGATPDKLAEVGAKLTNDQIAMIHEGLKRLAGVCNGAVDWDGMGFSKIDTMIGKSLAFSAFLSRKQAALGMRLCIKYRGQLGDGMIARIKGDMV
jgi:SWI/SNF-related matrix-associated actin-dependent regulator 1 of chromatin subfamily A